MKRVYVQPDRRTSSEVRLSGIADDDVLTPRMARAAMSIATGSANHTGYVSDGLRRYRISDRATRRDADYEMAVW